MSFVGGFDSQPFLTLVPILYACARFEGENNMGETLFRSSIGLFKYDTFYTLELFSLTRFCVSCLSLTLKKNITPINLQIYQKLHEKCPADVIAVVNVQWQR